MKIKSLILLFLLICDFSYSVESQLFGRESGVIISDKHIGTAMWQAAVLKAIGMPVVAYSLSDHQRYALGDPTFLRDPLFFHLSALPREVVHSKYLGDCQWDHFDHALCSFPPSYIRALEKLPPKVSLILNIGHRIHISVPSHELIDFTKRIAEMKRDPRYTIATMSEYDFHYMRYYTGLEPLRLPVISQHIPQKLRDAPYAPKNRVVLIGPSHNTNVILGFGNDLAQLNQLSASFAARQGLEPYTFNFIKRVYPNDQATIENLAQHPAVLMNPYSAFSISMVELYHLNIPFFVPDDALLVNAMDDVRLYPNYQSREAIASLESAYPVSSSGYLYSPNDESPDAQRYWMQYMFFNQVKHAERWSNPEELFQKLYLRDLSQLHDAMQSENKELFNEQLEAWKELFKKDH